MIGPGFVIRPAVLLFRATATRSRVARRAFEDGYSNLECQVDVALFAAIFPARTLETMARAPGVFRLALPALALRRVPPLLAKGAAGALSQQSRSAPWAALVAGVSAFGASVRVATASGIQAAIRATSGCRCAFGACCAPGPASPSAISRTAAAWCGPVFPDPFGLLSVSLHSHLYPFSFRFGISFAFFCLAVSSVR